MVLNLNCAKSLLFVLLMQISVGAAAAGNVGAPLTEFEAEYKVRASVASGELAMSLTAEADGVFMFRTLLSPRGFVRMFARGEIDESSRVIIRDDSVVPLDYTLRDTISKDHDADYRFNWGTGTVVGTDRGEPVASELQPGLLNRAALYVAIMRDLTRARLPEQYLLFDDGQVKTYLLENQGSDAIEVPYGRFDAVRLVGNAEGSRRSMYLWCAPELDFLPIRIELYKDDKRVSRAELRAVKGLPAS